MGGWRLIVFAGSERSQTEGGCCHRKQYNTVFFHERSPNFYSPCISHRSFSLSYFSRQVNISHINLSKGLCAARKSGRRGGRSYLILASTGSPKKDEVFFWGGVGGEQALSFASPVQGEVAGEERA